MSTAEAGRGKEEKKNAIILGYLTLQPQECQPVRPGKIAAARCQTEILARLRLARQFLNAREFVRVITVEEFYEKRGREAARELAARFGVLGLHVADALRCGHLQTRASRRLGENEAWLAAQAQTS